MPMAFIVHAQEHLQEHESRDQDTDSGDDVIASECSICNYCLTKQAQIVYFPTSIHFDVIEESFEELNSNFTSLRGKVFRPSRAPPVV